MANDPALRMMAAMLCGMEAFMIGLVAELKAGGRLDGAAIDSVFQRAADISGTQVNITAAADAAAFLKGLRATFVKHGI
jgi:hypothetical protein